MLYNGCSLHVFILGQARQLACIGFTLARACVSSLTFIAIASRDNSRSVLGVALILHGAVIRYHRNSVWWYK